MKSRVNSQSKFHSGKGTEVSLRNAVGISLGSIKDQAKQVRNREKNKQKKQPEEKKGMLRALKTKTFQSKFRYR